MSQDVRIEVSQRELASIERAARAHIATLETLDGFVEDAERLEEDARRVIDFVAQLRAVRTFKDDPAITVEVTDV